MMSRPSASSMSGVISGRTVAVLTQGRSRRRPRVITTAVGTVSSSPTSAAITAIRRLSRSDDWNRGVSIAVENQSRENPSGGNLM